MRAYGHSRRDKLECKFGCCVGKSGKHLLQRHCRDKAKPKAARRELTAQAGLEMAEIRHEKIPESKKREETGTLKAGGFLDPRFDTRTGKILPPHPNPRLQGWDLL